MDQNAKKKIAAIKKLIQQKSYKQALEDLEVLVYKYPKLYQVHLMAGLCYQKLENPLQAEKAFLEVIDLKPDEPNAIKQLCDIYTRANNLQKSTRYLEMGAELLKKTDDKKYRQTILKLVEVYQKMEDLEKVDKLLNQYCAIEESIGQDFAKIAAVYFKLSATNSCFKLDKFLVIGLRGQLPRPIIAAACEPMNHLLIDIAYYLRAVSKQYKLSDQDISNAIYQLKVYFPQPTCMLMLFLFDQYCMSHLEYSTMVLGQIYKLLRAHFDKESNQYTNTEYTNPQIFGVCMCLGYEYLTFFKEFFTLDPAFTPYYTQLALQYESIDKNCKIRQDYRKKMSGFILSECRQLNSLSKYSNVERRLQELKARILSLNNSFLQEVVAKIALHCFTSYEKINDIKNLLKLRIKNLKEGTASPHLYKYYYEYIFKIAKSFKSLDEEIPIADIHDYIAKHDPTDLLFYLERIWYKFCKIAKSEQTQQSKNASVKDIMAQISQADFGNDSKLQSIALRKLIILGIYLGDNQVCAKVDNLLKIQRSFQNLQVGAFIYYETKNYQLALCLLKEAFRLNQNHYHLNRLIFICLLKCATNTQAFDFVQRIEQGFTSVFWVNYLVGLSKSNRRQFMEAERYMIRGLECFNSTLAGNVKFSFEKVKDIGKFSLLCLVRQNEYQIYYDEIIFPEEFIYSQFSVASSLNFERNAVQTKLSIYLKEAELLKIIGRTKTSLNFLQQIYQELSTVELKKDLNSAFLFNLCVLRKQYSTLLFYMRQFKDSEAVLTEAMVICGYLQKGLLTEKLQNEIKALSFQISVERMSILMKFQSYEFISEYIKVFSTKIISPSKPSLNFLKNKYQYDIYSYLHTRSSTTTFQSSISNFLNYFGLDLKELNQVQFETKYFALKDQHRTFVRQALEDYFSVNYIGDPDNLREEQLFHMLELFPRSTIFLILLGMVTKNIKWKTAAFMRCIQLDKESSISVDILASLFLKQKNYLKAAQLFLKSQQIDVLNIKCYIGLSICLICLISRAVSHQEPQQLQIIKKCLVKINSYLEFVRINDPSEKYHLMNFIKLLLTDQNKSNLEIKLNLQSAKRACWRYKQTLIGALLEEASKDWQELNIWNTDHQEKVISAYLKESKIEAQLDGIVMKLGGENEKMIAQLHKNYACLSKQLIVKYIQQLLHKTSIMVNLALKDGNYHQHLFELFVRMCNQCSNVLAKASIHSLELKSLKLQTKIYLFEYAFKEKWCPSRQALVVNIFPEISYFGHLCKFSGIIPNAQKQIAITILRHPQNEQVRSLYINYLISSKCQHVKRTKISNYRAELVNVLNQLGNGKPYQLKKLILLFQDDYATIQYISCLWTKSEKRSQINIRKWLARLDLIKSVNQQYTQKIRRLKIQLISYARAHEWTINAILCSRDQEIVNKLSIVYKIIDKALTGRKQQLGHLFANLKACYKQAGLQQLDSWIFLVNVSYADISFIHRNQIRNSTLILSYLD